MNLPPPEHPPDRPVHPRRTGCRRGPRRSRQDGQLHPGGPRRPGQKTQARTAAGCDNVGARAGAVSESALASSAVCLLNVERTSRGLRALRVNGRLSAAAQSHTNDMVRRRYFSHTSRSGNGMGDRIRSQGYLSGARSWMIGENLAWGSGERSTPRSIVRAWMNSAGPPPQHPDRPLPRDRHRRGGQLPGVHRQPRRDVHHDVWVALIGDWKEPASSERGQDGRKSSSSLQAPGWRRRPRMAARSFLCHRGG